MAECEFCRIIKYKLDRDIPIASELDIPYHLYKINFKIRPAVSICRGFNLCKTHTITIKKDNKLRISEGLEIPNSLEIIKKMTRSDI